MFKVALAAAVAFAVPMLAEARTFTVDGMVTLSTGLVSDPDGGAIVDYPPVGSLGQLVFSLGENGAGPVDPNASFLVAPGDTLPFDADVHVGGFNTGFMGTGPDGEVQIESLFADMNHVRFSGRRIGQGIMGETFAGSLKLLFTPALAEAPTTWNDLFDAIDSGSVLAALSFNGTIQGQYAEFAFEQTPPVAPVPLPATVMFLLTGLAGFAAARRRKA